MLLVDVGNTNIKIYKDGKTESKKAVKSFDFPKEKFYYICVNSDFKNILKNLDHSTDIEPMIELDSDYIGLGVDRKVVCKAVKNAVVVDAGSAITVDVVKDSVHKGGFITLGLHTFQQSFASISQALEYDLDEKINLDKLPQNTSDALNFATFLAIIESIKSIREDLPLIFCGGDGEVLQRFFKDSSYEKDLVFLGMKKVIKESGC